MVTVFALHLIKEDGLKSQTNVCHHCFSLNIFHFDVIIFMFGEVITEPADEIFLSVLAYSLLCITIYAVLVCADLNLLILNLLCLWCWCVQGILIKCFCWYLLFFSINNCYVTIAITISQLSNNDNVLEQLIKLDLIVLMIIFGV